jgi:carbon storage regulator
MMFKIQPEAAMLVLSRQRDQSVMIADDIEVRVVDVRGDKVRLGFNAPRDIPVHRKEVYDAIRRENFAAAQVKPEDLPKLPTIRPAGAQVHSPSPPTKPLDEMNKDELLGELDLVIMGDEYDQAITILHMLKQKFPKHSS